MAPEARTSLDSRIRAKTSMQNCSYTSNRSISTQFSRIRPAAIRQKSKLHKLRRHTAANLRYAA